MATSSSKVASTADVRQALLSLLTARLTRSLLTIADAPPPQQAYGGYQAPPPQACSSFFFTL